MPCCKAQEFGYWCYNEDIIEYEGEHYCVFHLPNESPDKPGAREFNKLVFERIDEAKKKSIACYLSGAQFPGEIDFSRYGQDNPLPPISFFGAFFSGLAGFSTAAFSGDANFSSAFFSGLAGFSSATFGRDAHFSLVVISGDAIFTQAAFSGLAGFSSAAFSGKAYFSSATFSGKAYFSSAAFSGDAHFSSAAFSGKAYFRSATFRGKAYFRSAAFSGDTHFSSAAFNGDAHFSSAVFNGKAYFRSAVFSGDAHFRLAVFNGYAHFSSAALNRDANFRKSVFIWDANFSKAAFNGYAGFIEAAFSGDAHFEKSQFKASVNFRKMRIDKKFFLTSATLAAEANFNHAEFEQSAVFSDTTFAGAYFDYCHFHSTGYFKRTQLGVLRFDACLVDQQLEFDQAVLSRAEFSGAPLEKFRFIDCTWPRHRGRVVVYEARQVKMGEDTQGFVELDEPKDLEPHKSNPEAKRLADIFRRLKKIAEKEKEQPLISDWHYWEKEMQLIARKKGVANSKPTARTWWADLGMFLVLLIYKTASGFGESPFRALAWLVVLVLLPLLPWLWGSLGWDLLPNYSPAVWWDKEVFPGEPLGYIPLVKHTPDSALSRGTKLWMGLWQALIYLQTAWAALALRNKLRR